jgi:hypothetical protein
MNSNLFFLSLQFESVKTFQYELTFHVWIFNFFFLFGKLVEKYLVFLVSYVSFRLIWCVNENPVAILGLKSRESLAFLSRRSGNFSTFFFFSGIQKTFLHFIYTVFFKSLTFISGLCRRVWLLDVAIYKMKCQVGPRPKLYDNLFPDSFLSIGKPAERLRVWTNGHHSHSRNVIALLATMCQSLLRGVFTNAKIIWDDEKFHCGKRMLSGSCAYRATDVNGLISFSISQLISFFF